MKKVAVTVAVLALGLAACGAETEENAAGNEVLIENEADMDTGLAMNEMGNDVGNAAENALDAASNSLENAGESISNAEEAISNAE